MNEVKKSQVRTATYILFRNRNHEAQVRAREKVLPLFVTLLNALCEFALFSCGKKRVLPDLLEIHLYRIIRRVTALVSVFFMREHFLGLEIKKSATFEYVHARITKLLVKCIEEKHILLDQRKLL